MTFDEFVAQISVPAKHQRYGQHLMNNLFNVRRDLYDLIDGTDYDCFYYNNRVNDTLAFLSENWD
jgi:hypothetical protein